MRVYLEQYYAKQGTATAASTSDEIEYTYTIRNNGLLSIFNIEIEDETLNARGVTIKCTDVDSNMAADGSSDGAFTGLAEHPDNGLAPAMAVICTANDTATQEEVMCTLWRRNSHRDFSPYSLNLMRKKKMTEMLEMTNKLSANQ